MVEKHQSYGITLKMSTIKFDRANVIQELGECIPSPIWKFLAPPNRKSMGHSGLLMIFVSRL